MGSFDWDTATGRLRWPRRPLPAGGWIRRRAATYALFIDGVHEDDRRGPGGAAGPAMRGEAGYDCSYRVRRPTAACATSTGAARWSHRDATGAATRLIGTVQDVTDRLRAQAALAEQQHIAARDAVDHAAGLLVRRPSGVTTDRTRHVRDARALSRADDQPARRGVLRRGPMRRSCASALAARTACARNARPHAAPPRWQRLHGLLERRRCPMTWARRWACRHGLGPDLIDNARQAAHRRVRGEFGRGHGQPDRQPQHLPAGQRCLVPCPGSGARPGDRPRQPMLLPAMSGPGAYWGLRGLPAQRRAAGAARVDRCRTRRALPGPSCRRCVRPMPA